MTRAERERTARELRREGLMLREIAARMGVSIQYVGDLLNDPDRSRAKARRAVYATCMICGRPADGSNGRRDEAVCQRCRDQERAWPQAVIDHLNRCYERGESTYQFSRRVWPEADHAQVLRSGRVLLNWVTVPLRSRGEAQRGKPKHLMDGAA